MHDVLIVEDEPEIKNFITEILAEEGYRLRAVGDGPRALASVAEHQPALVLLDMGLPGISGLEVLKTLRSSFAELPIIMMTANADAGDLARSLGATDYLPKPFDLDALLALVARFAKPASA